MPSFRRLAMTGLISSAVVLAITGHAHAEVTAETQFILNSFLFLVAGFLVMFMAAGFAMLEAGLVRQRSVSTQLTKNVGLYSLSGIMYYIIGYNLMYTDVGSYFGSISLFYNPSAEELALVAGAEGATMESLGEAGYSIMSDWFFQMVFVATAASIVSGTLAERIRLVPFFIFVIILTGILYPITGSWGWGGGWLSEMGFSDFAGSTIVHSVGGWAALAGAIVLGARRGKYGPGGRINVMPGSNMTLVVLGTFILWLGWFGFNGGSQLAMGSGADVIAISNIFVNTNLAACGGVVATLLLTQLFYGKIDLTMICNGALAGLVSITAGPLDPNPLLAIIIGAVGGAIVVFTVPMLEKLRIDDVVGAIPVHLFCGIWGTLAVPLATEGASFFTQFIGIIAYGVFTFVVSFVVFMFLKFTIGLRVEEEMEIEGIDRAEIGIDAYPDFVTK